MNKQISDDQARQTINSMDLGGVIDRMRFVHNWTKKSAELAETQYRNYLLLCKKYGETHPLPPSHEIDEFWHNHVLCTRRYTKDCEKIFGYYLHHDPHHGDRGTILHEDLVQTFKESTRELYFKEFGVPLSHVEPNWLAKLLVKLKWKLHRPYK